MDASLSEYIQMMVEAGRKQFDREIQYDEPHADLRKQRNELLEKLEDAREQISELESQVKISERQEIIAYLQDNPGASRPEIIQHIANTTTGRVTELLTTIEGSEIRTDDNARYYAAEEDLS